MQAERAASAPSSLSTGRPATLGEGAGGSRASPPPSVTPQSGLRTTADAEGEAGGPRGRDATLGRALGSGAPGPRRHLSHRRETQRQDPGARHSPTCGRPTGLAEAELEAEGAAAWGERPFSPSLLHCLRPRFQFTCEQLTLVPRPAVSLTLWALRVTWSEYKCCSATCFFLT